MYFQSASILETFNIIHLLNINKSCGLDGIEVKFLRIATEVLALPLTDLINCCLKHGVFPDCLKIARVTPVFKSGNRHYIINYRPISLLSNFSKILEKIVYVRTINFFWHPLNMVLGQIILPLKQY